MNIITKPYASPKLLSQFVRVERKRTVSLENKEGTGSGSRTTAASSMKKALGVNDQENRFATKYNEFRAAQYAIAAPLLDFDDKCFSINSQ